MTPIPLSWQESMRRTSESRQKCARCKHFAWVEPQEPESMGGEWHHPSCPEVA